MRYIFWFCLGLLAIALPSTALASTYSIPADKIDTQKVYYGTPNGFDKAGKVDYDAIIKSTPEYGEVKKKKIEPGTGKYWILLSQASERAQRAISEVGQESGFDLIASQAYLGGMESTIPSEDVTSLIMKKVKGEEKPSGERPTSAKGSTDTKPKKETVAQRRN